MLDYVYYIPSVAQIILPQFDVATLKASDAVLKGVSAVFVTLGVGAPSRLPRTEEGKLELMTVDCLLPAALADAAQRAGVRHFSLLTAGMPCL